MEDQFWPQPGDKLFVESTTGKGCWVRPYAWRSVRHAEGFRHAADVLVDHFLAAPRRGDDELIWPIVYAYRHALELKLKTLVRLGITVHLYDKEDVARALGLHGLGQLWEKARIVIDDCWPNSKDGSYAAVDDMINEIHQIERNGEFWRYAFDRDGKPHDYGVLPEHVDLENLKKKANAAFNFFDGCEDGIDAGIQAMQDAM